MRTTDGLLTVGLLLLAGCGFFGGEQSDTEYHDWCLSPCPCQGEEPATVELVALTCPERWTIQDVTAGPTFSVALHMIRGPEDRERWLMSTLEDYHEDPDALALPEVESSSECTGYDELHLVPGAEYHTDYVCDDMSDLTFFLVATWCCDLEKTCVGWGKDPEAYDEWGCEPITPSDTLLWTE